MGAHGWYDFTRTRMPKVNMKLRHTALSANTHTINLTLETFVDNRFRPACPVGEYQTMYQNGLQVGK